MMAKASTKRVASRKRDQKPEDGRPWVGHVVTILVAALGIGGGAYLQDKYDVLKTNRTLAITYSEAANTSAEAVDEVVKSIFDILRDPSARFTKAQVAELRNALLDLHRDAQRLTIQVGASDEYFQEYAKAMADLASAAEQVVGPGDSDPLVEALEKFYMEQREFDANVASMYSPPSA